MAAIEPFTIAASDDELADLKHRLDNARWPEKETPDDWTQGIPLAYTKEICTYWANEYDWRAREARLNEFPQFRTEVDGLNIHFVHVRSPEENALPLVMTHGWPGSIVEFHKVIEPLVDPTKHGGDASDAFHLILPTLPGFGFSGKPAETGWGVERTARRAGPTMRASSLARSADAARAIFSPTSSMPQISQRSRSSAAGAPSLPRMSTRVRP